MNYGTLTIVDGVYMPATPPADAAGRGLARMGIGPDGALAPPVLSARPESPTVVIELRYNYYAQKYAGGKAPLITSVPISYSKSIKRLAKSGNPLGSATSLISQLAGCDEAKMVRGRAIALSRIHKTISGEAFKFRLGDS